MLLHVDMAINMTAQDKKKKRITDFIDFNLSGRHYDFTNLSLAPFVAGFLQEIMALPCFKSAVKPLQERIRHLSFLVHLACRFDNFDSVIDHYNVVDKDIETGLANWEDDGYFRTWEQRILTEIFFTGGQDDDPEHLIGRAKNYNACEPKIEIDTNSNCDAIENVYYGNGDCIKDEDYVPEKEIKIKVPAKKRIKKCLSSVNLKEDIYINIYILFLRIF